MWDTPMATWAGRHDWIQKLIRRPPRKEDVIVALMKRMGQPTTRLEKKPGGIRSKEPRDLDSTVLEPQTKSEGMEFGNQG